MYPSDHDNNVLCTSFTQEYDYDDDYDVYLFWPSSSPHILVPVRGGHVDELPALPSPVEIEIESDTEDELEPLDLGLADVLAFSPSFSVDPHFVFPDTDNQSSTDGMDMDGYSRVFRMGLVSKSRKLTRHLDGIFRSAWQTVASSMRKLKFSRR